MPGADETLYQQLLGGDLSAFDELYERHSPHLFGFLRRQLDDAAEAEDVLHEAFLAILKERKAGRAARSFKAWLFQVARNLCLNRFRTQQRSDRALSQVANELATAEGAVHADRALERGQLGQALHAAVTRLPPTLSELYHLRAGGLSYEELAEVLGLPLGTVKSRMHELVSRLRLEMPT